MSIDPELAVVALSPPWFEDLGEWITQLRWHPAGRVLAASSASGRVMCVDTVTRARTDCPSHAGAVLSMAWSPKGAVLATGGDDGAIMFYREGTGTSWRGRGWVNTLDWSSDSSRVGVGIGRDVSVITATDGAEVGRVRCASTVTGVAWTGPDRLAAAAYGGLQWVDHEARDVGRYALLFGGSPRALQLSPDGRLLATGCQGGATYVWELDAPSEPIVLPGTESGGQHLAWDPRSERLAVAASGITTIWDFRVDADALPRGTGLDVRGMPSAASWSPDGEHVALGIRLPNGGGVVLWQPGAGCLPVLAVDAGCAVSAVAWSPNDPHTLAVGTAEGTVCVIDPIALLPTC